MFSIGAFSKLAQLSVRVLRHYDEIGLLVPAHTQRGNGYRFYTADQLADVQRIVALKELGLTLEQVQTVMHEELCVDEIAGMLRLEKLRAEQARDAAERRLIELDRRLTELRDMGRLSEIDVVEKSIPASPYLAYRTTVASLVGAYELMNDIVRACAKQAGSLPLIAIAYDSFFDTENLDLELGYPIAHPTLLDLGQGRVMLARELEPVERMLSVMYVGDQEEGHRHAHHALGLWLASHACDIAGPGREIVHARQAGTAPAVEIQYPIAAR